MSDVNEMSFAERREAEATGRQLADKHHVGTDHNPSASAVDAMAELLDRTGLKIDAKDEAAMRAIVLVVWQCSSSIATINERQRVLTALGAAGARLSAAELAAIGNPGDGWWFAQPAVPRG